MKIGLLGGSFNPPHEGHYQISLQALKRLGLHQLWWIINPQNPLKSNQHMISFQKRLILARKMINHPKIKILDLEYKNKIFYTIDTLRFLKKRYTHHSFVWLIGADNLIQINEWKNWQQLFSMIPIIVFDRPLYSLKASASKAASRYAKFRIPERKVKKIFNEPLPIWAYLHNPLNNISATFIRTQNKDIL
ncbi:MAG: nicotinate (nicotinamide) nucleotide adenylyltransferase [Alphaproteobacteria bacterium]|nr:nicotinate (nicotinamide) nucleotide adenylyltransferase [Alphaproteobacteria bacterium]